MTFGERSPCIQICRGKYCRKFEEAYTTLRSLLPDATETGCFGICKGPVVKVNGRSFKKLHTEKRRACLLQHLKQDHNAFTATDWLGQTPEHIIHAHKPLKQKHRSKNIGRAQNRLQHLIAGNHFAKQPLIILEGPPGFGQNTIIKLLLKSLMPEQLQIRPLRTSFLQRPSLLLDSLDPNVLTILQGSVFHPSWPLLGSDGTGASLQHCFDSLHHAFHITPIALFVSRKKQRSSLTKMDKRLGTALSSQMPSKHVWDRQHLERLRALLSNPAGLNHHPVEWTLANGNHKAALKLTVLERIIASITAERTHCESESVSSPTGTSTAFSKLNAASETNDNSSSAESSSSVDPDSLVGEE